MSLLINSVPIEPHIFSAEQDPSLVELLTVLAHYHATGAQLNLGHTVDFGKPWQANSKCTCGVLSLPYLDGPKLESMVSHSVKCYWLIPITKQERDFKIKHGLEQLEKSFDTIGINYIDASRESAV